MNTNTDFKIIFFDGDCSLCNQFVQFVIARDPNGMFRFAPLGGKTSVQYNIQAPRDTNQLWTTIVYFDPQTNQTLSHSNAALAVITKLGFPYSLLKISYIIPKFIRDFFYRLVSKNRYKIWGDKSNCRLPTEEEAKRILH